MVAAGGDVMMLFLTGFIYLVIVFVIENYHGRLFVKKHSEGIPHEVDPDV